MKIVPAYTQAGVEALRWLGEAEMDGSFREDLKNRDYKFFAIRALHKVLKHLPPVPSQKIMRSFVNPQLDVVAIGAETVVVRDGEYVNKYISGKTENPDILQEKLAHRLHKIARHLGSHMLPSTVTVEEIQLWRFGRPERYAVIRQPYLKIDKLDPQRDEAYLQIHPGVRSAVGEIADGVHGLAYEKDPLYMDVTNGGNIAEGSYLGNESGVYFIDPIAAAEGESFCGLNVPGWTEKWYLRSIEYFKARYGSDS